MNVIERNGFQVKLLIVVAMLFCLVITFLQVTRAGHYQNTKYAHTFKKYELPKISTALVAQVKKQKEIINDVQTSIEKIEKSLNSKIVNDIDRKQITPEGNPKEKKLAVINIPTKKSVEKNNIARHIKNSEEIKPLSLEMPFVLTGFKGDLPITISFVSLCGDLEKKLASQKQETNSEIITEKIINNVATAEVDELTTAQAATERKIPEEIKDEPLVFYEYNNVGTAEVTGKVTEYNPATDPANQILKNVISTTPKVDKARKSDLSGQISAENIIDGKNSTAAEEILDTHKSSKSKASKQLLIEYSVFTMAPKLVIWGAGFSPEQLQGRATLLSDVSTQLESDTDGMIEYPTKLANDYSSVSFLVSHFSSLPVLLDLPQFDDPENAVIVPMFEITEFDRWLDKQNVKGDGGFVLVSLDAEADRVEIDVKYEKKFFLDTNFKAVDSSDEYQYVLFAGVRPGNTLLRIESTSADHAEKIISVRDQAVTFEINKFVSPMLSRISIFEQKIFSKKEIGLTVEEDELAFFNRDVVFKKIAPNVLQYQRPLMLQGVREYFDLKSDVDGMFIGKWGDAKIEVPDQKVVEQTLNELGINDRRDGCVLQLNLDKDAVGFNFVGDRGDGSMQLSEMYKDKDGTFSREFTELVEKIYITGEEQGTIYFHLNYLDGTENHFKSYCSRGLYIVEQL